MPTLTDLDICLIREIAGAGHRLLCGKALDSDLPALRTACGSLNSEVAAMASLIRDAFNGVPLDGLGRCDIATLGNVLDFEASQTRRMLAKEASKNWSPDGRGDRA